MANKIIKNKFKPRNNYNQIIGITLRGNKFKNEIWVRNTEKLNQVGRRCNNAFSKEELRELLDKIWKSIIDGKINDSFLKDNVDKYNRLSDPDISYRKDEICPFIGELFKYANDKKINNKVWYQELG